MPYLARPAVSLARKLIKLWVRTRIQPEDIAARVQERTAARPRAVCYVLERQSLSDLMVLQNSCAALGLPNPSGRLPGNKRLNAQRRVCYLQRRVGWIGPRVDRRPPVLLAELIAAARADPGFNLDIVPVAIFWGRAPQKEGSWFRLLLSENWALAGRFRKFMTVLFNGRNTLVQFGEPLELRSFVEDGQEQPRAVRRMARTLRTLFRKQRAATIGPDLSHRRTVVAQVLATRTVRAAVAQLMRDKQLTRHAALLEAKRYADEIAANYSHAFVRFMAGLLSRLWNRLYDGVRLHHANTLQQVAEDHELVFAPCHRSHMDYLLLSYVIYQKGFAVPHTAAGVNLNMPVIGRFLRKGGAFFLRRSFRGDYLYAAVFQKYLSVMMSKGHSLEYFIEGGRSRTGRLLQPKTGMLSMTVRSYLRDPKRPVMFVPVYFGYERLVEGQTYIDELSGRPKRKESILGLIKTLPVLKENFGTVHVSIGEPIALQGLLQRFMPPGAVPPADDKTRPEWLDALVNGLARDIMTNINAAAVVTPVNLLAMVLLAMPRQSMVESELVRQLDLYLALMKAAPYSTRVRIGGAANLSGVESSTEDAVLDGQAIVRYGERMGILERRAHTLGDVLSMSEANAVLMTYFRNNVLHLFAMPSLVACCFLSNAEMRTEDLQRLAVRIYPYIADELFLRWREDEIAQVVLEILQVFDAHGLLKQQPSEDAFVGRRWRRSASASFEAVQLSVLGQGSIQIVERYYLAIALLVQAGSGTIDPEALVTRCQLMAQRMAMLYGLSAPEFFDRALFSNFIDMLCRRGVIRRGEDGLLVFDQVLLNVANDAQLVLSEQLRHSILQVTHG